MDSKNGFIITNRDRVMRAWLNSTELVRDYQQYSHEIREDDEDLSDLFAEYAEHEAEHATKLRDILYEYEN